MKLLIQFLHMHDLCCNLLGNNSTKAFGILDSKHQQGDELFTPQ
nr:hypothetical protein [Paraglaciecola sp. G1-23]